MLFGVPSYNFLGLQREKQRLGANHSKIMKLTLE